MSSHPAGGLITVGYPSEVQVRAEVAAPAIRHALFWMMVANAVGLWLAWLLLVPRSGAWLGEFTYGRWVPVHLNLHLYGWTSLPLVAWLLVIYRAGSCSRSAVWAWSMALGVGVATWVSGQSSGKIFLDWTALSRVLFPLVLVYLWSVLARGWWQAKRDRRMVRMAKALGLLALAIVPALLYWASGGEVYPAVNPESGGPTGVDLLGSTLSVVLILLLIPLVQERPRKHLGRSWSSRCWGLFIAQMAMVAVIGMGHASHREWPQWLSLGSLTAWIALMPAYYRGFAWPESSCRWLTATLIWFGFLTATGWLSFLPNVLDHLKFTDGLVAHSHLAMAGFVTSLNFFLVSLIGTPLLVGVINRPLAFWTWNGATATYVILMWVAGAHEGANPAFTITPDMTRNLLYLGRLLAGMLLFSVSVYWWLSARTKPTWQASS